MSLLQNVENLSALKICSTCKFALDKKLIPNYIVLHFLSARLLSPRIPFVQIRRLRHVQGQFQIYGQIINVPVSVDTMVKSLPKNINEEHCIYVHIKKN